MPEPRDGQVILREDGSLLLSLNTYNRLQNFHAAFEELQANKAEEIHSLNQGADEMLRILAK